VTTRRAFLGVELDGAGVAAGPRADDMVSLTPPLDWVSLARGMGVPAIAVDDAESLMAAVSQANIESGPR
jgi:acetolactate synthase I/II/III large subunit